MMIKAISILKQYVKLKGDSETVLKYLKADSACLASFGNVIEDTRALSLQLSTCSFSHVRRKGNVVAYS